MTAAPEDSLPAALLKLAALDEREGEHFRQLQETLGEQQETVGELAEHVASLLPPAPGPGYQPIATVTWWQLGDEERQEAIARIRDWIASIYCPMYGHLAVQLGDCWDSHPLALVTLDWLSELWSILYLKPTRCVRDLQAQAEFAVRIVPAAAALLGTETGRCTQHVDRGNGRRP